MLTKVEDSFQGWSGLSIERIYTLMCYECTRLGAGDGGAVFNEHPLFITYIGENAVDDGGVQRDMFSAFWSSAYVHLFEGSKTLIPMVQPGIDITNFSTLGKIISHGYLECGFLPVRIALPSLIL